MRPETGAAICVAEEIQQCDFYTQKKTEQGTESPIRVEVRRRPSRISLQPRRQQQALQEKTRYVRSVCAGDEAGALHGILPGAYAAFSGSPDTRSRRWRCWPWLTDHALLLVSIDRQSTKKKMLSIDRRQRTSIHHLVSIDRLTKTF